MRLFEGFLNGVVAASLEEQAVDIGAIWSLFGFVEIFVVQDLVLPAY